MECPVKGQKMRKFPISKEMFILPYDTEENVEKCHQPKDYPKNSECIFFFMG